MGGNRGDPGFDSMLRVYEQPGNKQPNVQVEPMPQSWGGGEAGVALSKKCLSFVKW